MYTFTCESMEQTSQDVHKITNNKKIINDIINWKIQNNNLYLDFYKCCDESNIWKQ